MGCFLFLLWLQQLLQGPLNFQTNLKNFVAMPSVRNVRHVRLVYRWRKSAEPGWSIHLIHSPSIPDHLADALRSQRNAAELSLWSAKLVMLVSPRRNCRRNPHSPVCPRKKQCCRAFTLECQACDAGVSEEEFCRRNPHSPVCPQKKQCCRAFTLECQACD